MKKKGILIALSIHFALGVSAQDVQVIDSLNGLLLTKRGGDRFQPLYELTFEYIDRDNQRALDLITQAEEAALASGDSLWIVKSKRVRGQVLSRLEKLRESMVSCEDARSIAMRNGFKLEYGYICNNLGTSYGFTLQPDRALASFFETLRIARELNDSSLVSTAIHNIGVMYFTLADYEKGLAFLLQALDMSRKINEVDWYELKSISLCYARMGKFGLARLYLKESVSVCGDECAPERLAAIYTTKGEILIGEKRYSEAERTLSTAYSFAKEVNSTYLRLDIIESLAGIYMDQNRVREARKILGEAEEMASRGSAFNLQLLRVYKRLCELKLRGGDFKAASGYQQKYILLNDSLSNSGVTSRLMAIESEFRERRNQQLIAEKEQIIALNAEVIKRQYYLNAAAAVAGALALSFAVVVLRGYQKKKVLNLMLERRVHERTRELEINTNRLAGRMRELEHSLMRMGRAVEERSNRLSGLCIAAEQEAFDEIAHGYIERVRTVSAELRQLAEGNCAVSRSSQQARSGS